MPNEYDSTKKSRATNASTYILVDGVFGGLEDLPYCFDLPKVFKFPK